MMICFAMQKKGKQKEEKKREATAARKAKEDCWCQDLKKKSLLSSVFF